MSEVSLSLPAVGRLQILNLDLSKTKNAESRLHEAKTVNPSTYTDLEYTFNEAYRELKRALSAISYRLAKAEEEIENIKAELVLDKYPEFIKDKPKSFDTADTRRSFIQKDQAYLKACDHRDQVKALEILLDSRVKVMEKTCSYMRKQIDMVIRSGSSQIKF
jgi:hypothetical protein